MVRFSLNMSILCMTKIRKGFKAKHREIIARPYMKKTKEKLLVTTVCIKVAGE